MPSPARRCVTTRCDPRCEYASRPPVRHPQQIE